jgi:hypothetical protein
MNDTNSIPGGSAPPAHVERAMAPIQARLLVPIVPLYTPPHYRALKDKFDSPHG